MRNFITCKARFRDDETDLSELGIANYEINWHWEPFAFDLNKVTCCSPADDLEGTSIWLDNGESWIIDILFEDLMKQL